MTAMRDTSWIKRSYPDPAYGLLSSAQVFDDKCEDQVNAPLVAVRARDKAS
jgi:hypothetical protein